MNIGFSKEEMAAFLKKKGYRSMEVPVKWMSQHGPYEEEMVGKVAIAIKPFQRTHLESLKSWKDPIETEYGLETVFYKELKNTLLSL